MTSELGLERRSVRYLTEYNRRHEGHGASRPQCLSDLPPSSHLGYRHPAVAAVNMHRLPGYPTTTKEILKSF